MKYESLLKQYYKSSDNGLKIYEELISYPHTIKFNIYNKSYPFFVCLNNEMLKLVSDILYLNAQLITLIYCNRELPDLISEWIINHTLVEEVMMTNEIEGVVSTRKEIKQIIQDRNNKGYKRLYGLVKKYQDLCHRTYDDITSVYDIRALYDNTMYLDIKKDNSHNLPDGKLFRKENVEVVASNSAIHQGVYPESMIIDYLDEAIKILNDESICLLIRVAIFHYLFAYIHPFYDGNGRMARLISSIYLAKELDITAALQVSVACKLRQKEYYDSFKVTNDIRNKGDLTYFVLSFLEIYKHGLKELKEAITDKIHQYYQLDKVIYNLTLDNSSKKIINLLLQATLFTANSLTLEEIIDKTGLSKSTIKNRLAIKEVSQLLKVEKESKYYIYSLDLDKLTQ